MHRQRNSTRARMEANARRASGVIAAAPTALPAWNRERLIQQFQDIDGSTRSEAETQIDAYERSFWDGFAASHGNADAADRCKD